MVFYQYVPIGVMNGGSKKHRGYERCKQKRLPGTGTLLEETGQVAGANLCFACVSQRS